ncbi:hypothetical protein ENHYDAX1_130105 [Enhydrobacter sp. AX1]|nr:hypothetical protein ENHYDAX1_130105 [Enhydrobacter sp. AX1]
MGFTCPHCQHELYDLFNEAMDEMKKTKGWALESEYDAQCPCCKNTLNFTTANGWYCLIMPNGELKKLGID